MIFSQFVKAFYEETGTDEGSFSLDRMCTLINIVIEEITLLANDPVLDTDDFARVFSHGYTPGTRKYTLPTDMLGIKVVSIVKDGEVADAEERDMSYFPLNTKTSEEKIYEYMKGKKPVYEIFGNTIYIYADEETDTTATQIIVYGYQYPSPVTEKDLESTRDMSSPSNDTSAGIPRKLHVIVLYRTVIAYKGSRDKPLALTQTQQQYSGTLRAIFISQKTFNRDTRWKMSEPNDSYSRPAFFDPLTQ